MQCLGNVLKGATGLQTCEDYSVTPQCVYSNSGANIPFGKLQECNHLLQCVDLGQRVVGVHEYNSSNDQPLKERPVPK